MQIHSSILVLVSMVLLSGGLTTACSTEEERAQTEQQQRLDKIDQLESQFADLMQNRPNSADFTPTARYLAEEYRMFADYEPTHPEASEMMFRAANLQADALEQYTIAIALFRQIERRWPDTIQAERALFLAGYTYNHALDNTDSAREIYESFLVNYPESELRQAVEDELHFLDTDLEEFLRNFQPEQE